MRGAGAKATLRIAVAVCILLGAAEHGGSAAAQADATNSGLCFDATLIRADRVATLLTELPHGTELYPVVFMGGKTAFRVSPNLFRFASVYRGHDGLRDMLEAAETHGIAVCPTLDMLHWTLPSTMAADDIYTKRADLFALDSSGGTGPDESGRRASPFNTEVRDRLRRIAERVAEAYPEADGLGLFARLGADTVLGYDTAARVGFIRQARIDPIDVPVAVLAPADEEATAEWWQWRLDRMTDLVASVSQAYRARRDDGTVIAFGDAAVYEWDLRVRARACEDWLTWVAAGQVDRLILTGAWDDERYEGVYARALALIDRLDHPVTVQPLIPIGRDDGDFTAQLNALRAQADVPTIILQVDRSADLPRAVRLLNELAN